VKLLNNTHVRLSLHNQHEGKKERGSRPTYTSRIPPNQGRKKNKARGVLKRRVRRGEKFTATLFVYINRLACPLLHLDGGP
jgi:hypothetical protein